MAKFDYDLRYVQTGVGELKSYLLSKELFWPVSLAAGMKESPYPKMTPSNLLLSLARMQARQKGTAQSSALAQIETEMEVVVSKWRVKWEEKVAWEFTSRLRQWTHYLNELGQEPESHRAYYPSEVRLRAQLELLKDAISIAHDSLAALEGADMRLRAKLKPGDFIWEQDLAAGFPSDRFWFLYGVL